jgi:hypothetical protein
MVTERTPEFKIDEIQQQVFKIVQWTQTAAAEGTSAHEFERRLFQQMLAFGHMVYGHFLHKVGPGDLGPTTALDDGRVVTRWPQPVARRLLTLFGEFEISRCVYGTRPGQKIELVPTDQRLSLPEGELSYPLQEWDQLLGVEQAFGKVRETLVEILGLEQSVDTLEHGNRAMAESAPAFRAAQPAPDPAAEGEILVGTADNKGVPMVRPVEAQPAGAHRAKGEKANKKQMACIGCVYTVDPNVRTPEEMLEILFRERKRREPGQDPEPKAQQKRYWAALSRAVDEVEIRAQDEIFKSLRDDIALRRRPGQTLVLLMDGQHSLEDDRDTYLPRDRWTVEILDLMHVIPRLWEAAHLFHEEGSDAARDFVRKHLLPVLQGKARRVIEALRRLGRKRGLRGSKRQRLRVLCNFLESNLHRMRYHRYLRAGYPIATGVIEGACRHVIKDRMERAGMRWKVPGAQAMLQLRTIHANGDWRAFQDYRVKEETYRLYPNRNALDNIAWPLAA